LGVEKGSLEREAAGWIATHDVENALDEMLFSGGSLNVKLLGDNVGGNGSCQVNETR
jgi:hypothetical protein